LIPIDLLFEEPGLPSYDMPEELERLHGGGLGFETPRLYANFVSSLDGVVALEGVKQSSYVISGDSEADRFVMGLLRASADAVLIGAGTLEGSPGSLWTPAYIFPEAAEEFERLRKGLGRTDEPRLVVLSGHGRIDPHHPALEAGALVLTTVSGARELAKRLPSSSTVLGLGDDPALDLADAIAALRSEGLAVILSESGPTVTAGLLRAGLLDELFLTLSPILAGRTASGGRPGLVEGFDLLDAADLPGGRPISRRLMSVRRHGSHLFLRYALRS
jgi:riboflavin biosynthesis pyrimidine reductase